MTSQGRRKHSACLLRLKERCPFRKLRRSKCSESMNSIVLTGGQWESSQSITSVSNSDRSSAVRVETLSRPIANLQQEELSAMDTDMALPTSTPRPSYIVSGPAGPSHFNLINQQQRNLSSSNTSMDLDSGVDPETGERAQG